MPTKWVLLQVHGSRVNPRKFEATANWTRDEESLSLESTGTPYGFRCQRNSSLLHSVMHSTRTSRRTFLNAVAAASLATPIYLRAIEPFPRTGDAKLRLSLAAYSFRDDFVVPKNAPAGSTPKIDMFRFLDFCGEHGCDGAELTSYYFPPDVTAEYFARVRHHAHLRGISISGTAVGNVFTHPPGPERDHEIGHVKRWVDHAAVLGAPHIRVFAGEARKGQERAEAVKHCVTALEECAEYAGRRGIFLGVENHGGIVATPNQILEVVKAVKSPWVGINLDTGNFNTADPYADLARCAPYAVNVQFKGEIRREGAKVSERADTRRVLQLLRDARYQGWVALEYEMKPDPWIKVPELLAEMKKNLG